MDVFVTNFGGDEFLMRLFSVAEKLNCTPLDFMNWVSRTLCLISIALGFFLCAFFGFFAGPVLSHVIDRLFDGIAAIFRQFRSRRKKDL